MFGFIKKKRREADAVKVASPAQNSIRGKYFIGQTDQLTMSGLQQHAWGGLFNPAESGVRLFFDIYSISNLSDQFLNAEIWLNSKLAGNRTVSSLVHPTNLAIQPSPQPSAEVRYASEISGIPMEGVNIFNRIISPKSTLSSDSGNGGIVIPPGGSFAIFLKSPGPFKYASRIAFSWWEESNADGGSS